MADRSDQTIKEMLAGFSAMQFNLGLLPMQTTQSMAGAPMQMPPPPPMILHPSQAAANALAQQQMLIQQTMQAAQMTRYQPPPSAPTPAVSAMVGFGGMNPFAAPPVGGGVGFAPNSGAPGRPLGGPSLSPQIGGVFNPFAPTLPPAHFASPAQRNLQIMQTAHSQMMGTIAGVGEAGMGIGGSLVGGVLGSAFGPLGTMAGAWLGGKVGGGLSNMMFGPAVQDMARGRQIQAMTSPFMVSGPFLNSATGQGMNPYAARQVATGIRHLQRDYDFERTGFNTQDTMQIMQQSADQGLLKGIQSPDALVSKVKEISKTVKTLMRITGDPDVRGAIQALGEMKDLGFNGLGAQAGAVANRAMFARMAGVSQAQAGAYGMMGAGVAGQFGLGGSTGYAAGMSGAALANMAASSGALNDLQLARAGGKSGLAQINATGQLAAMQDERYLLAAMGRDARGNMTVDMSAYRRAQSMSFQEVSERAAESLRTMGKEGIFEWNTRKQEFKDQVAQKLTPFEMNMNMIRQAQAFKNQVPGMTMGTALQMTTGLSASDARALELQTQSRGWYDTQIQQLEAQKRNAQDQERAGRERFRTPGIMTRAGRGVRGFFGDISDSLSSSFTRMGEHFQHVAENEEAADRGQRIVRFSDAEIAHDAGERAMAGRALRSRGFQNAYRSGLGSNFLDGRNPLARAAGRQLNRMGSFLGLAAQSGENRLAALASRSRGTAFGWHPLESFGNADDALDRVMDVAGAADMSVAADSMTGSRRQAMVKSLGSGAEARLTGATTNLVAKLRSLTAGTVTSATALSRSDIRQAWIDAHPPDKRDEAARMFDKNPSIGAEMLSNVKAFGTQKMKEVIAKSEETGEGLGAINLARSRGGLDDLVNTSLQSAGLRNVDDEGKIAGYVASDKTLTRLGNVFGNRSKEEIAVAAALAAQNSTDKTTSRKGDEALKALQAQLGDKFGAVKDKAMLLKSESGDVQTALAHIASSGQAGNIMRRVETAQAGFGARKAGAMNKALQQTLAKYNPKAAAAGSPIEAAKALRLEDLENLKKDDPVLYEQVQKMREGTDAEQSEAAAVAAEHTAPSNTEARFGSRGGASVQELSRQQADVAAMRDKLSKDGGSDKQQLEAASVELFSTSVERFGKYVSDVVGGGEGTTLDRNNPYAIAARAKG